MDEGSSVEYTGQRSNKNFTLKKEKRFPLKNRRKLKCRMGGGEGVAYVVRCKKH